MKEKSSDIPVAFYIELPSRWLLEQIGKTVQRPQEDRPVDLEQVVHSQLTAIAPRGESERVIVKQCRRRKKQ